MSLEAAAWRAIMMSSWIRNGRRLLGLASMVMTICGGGDSSSVAKRDLCLPHGCTPLCLFNRLNSHHCCIGMTAARA